MFMRTASKTNQQGAPKERCVGRKLGSRKIARLKDSLVSSSPSVALETRRLTLFLCCDFMNTTADENLREQQQIKV